jgi:hypothetical protein
MLKIKDCKTSDRNTLLKSRKHCVGNIKEENGAHNMLDKREERLTRINVTVSAYKNYY